MLLLLLLLLLLPLLVRVFRRDEYLSRGRYKMCSSKPAGPGIYAICSPCRITPNSALLFFNTERSNEWPECYQYLSTYIADSIRTAVPGTTTSRTLVLLFETGT